MRAGTAVLRPRILAGKERDAAGARSVPLCVHAHSRMRAHDFIPKSALLKYLTVKKKHETCKSGLVSRE